MPEWQIHDRPGRRCDNAAGNGIAPRVRPAVCVCRGARDLCASRVLAAHGLTALAELPLPNGRRADVVGIDRMACSDRRDQVAWRTSARSQWPEYREFSDRLFFAVDTAFLQEVLPQMGLIIADRYGGEILRPAPEIRLRRRSASHDLRLPAPPLASFGFARPHASGRDRLGIADA